MYFYVCIMESIRISHKFMDYPCKSKQVLMHREMRSELLSLS
mgnify:CR=1 FL=1